MVIRKLRETDYEQYLVLINNFRKTAFTYQEFVQILEHLRPHTEIWVIEDLEELLATATIIYEQKFIHNLAKLAHVEDVCVQKKARGRGLGKILMHKLIDEAKQHGCYKITLDCDESVVEFYQKCGYELRGKQMTVYFG